MWMLPLMLFHMGCLVLSRRAKEVVEHLEHEVSGKLCKKTFLSGCQPAAVCEQDYEGVCDLKYDEDLVLEFKESKSSLVATAFQEVSPSEVPLLAAAMNSSTREFLDSVSQVTAALEQQGGQAVNFSAMFEIMQNQSFQMTDAPALMVQAFPSMARKEVASAMENVAATMAEVPACEDPRSLACGKGLLAKVLPTAEAQVEKLTALLGKIEQKVLGTGLLQVAGEGEGVGDFLMCWVGKAIAILTFQYFLVLSVFFFALWMPVIPIMVAMVFFWSFLLPCGLYLVPKVILEAVGLGAGPQGMQAL
ncbi:unnamed protein product [Symbiodinium sp. CCMP2592]|nr:unnamed protein product [Symbiodinium sp. CCMP2592]